MTIELILLVIFFGFLLEYTDKTLGMGYGTVLAPILLIMGFDFFQIMPAILVPQIISGIIVGVLHHKKGNADFKPKSTNVLKIKEKVREYGFLKSIKKGLPLHLKIAIIFGLSSVIGTVLAVFVAVNISQVYLKTYIGVLVLAMGILMFFTRNKKILFMKKRILAIGFLASFNKGISGGGYGPVVTSGQVLSGLTAKNAIAITSLSEGLTCSTALIAYYLVNSSTIDWTLAPILVIGSLVAIPFSVSTVCKTDKEKLKVPVSLFTILLGLFTLIKVFF